MTNFIKGYITRKQRLGRREQLPHEEKETPKEIIFNVDDISSFKSIGDNKSAVILRTPSFDNTNDFWIVCNSDTLPTVE